MRGATEAINLVAQSFGRAGTSAPGDEILITALEHHSNIVPWQLLCEERGARAASWRRSTTRGELTLDELERAARAAHEARRRRARLERARHGQPGRARSPRSRTRAARVVLVDGAQAVPHLPVDVRALGCDFYAFSGHKVYGPTGIGVLYGRARAARGDAALAGRRRHDRVASRFEKTTYARDPHNVRGRHARHRRRDRPRRGDRLRRARSASTRVARARARAARVRHASGSRAIPGVRLVGTAPRARPACSRSCSTASTRTTSARSSTSEGVAVRAGHHCAQPLMERFGVPATARASFGVYNTRDDVDALVARRCARRVEVFALMSTCASSTRRSILDHNKQPRNFRRARRTRTATREGNNPLCGDQLTVLRASSRTASCEDVGFEGSGCAISTASASLMTEAVKGKTRRRGRRALRALPRARDRRRRDASRDDERARQARGLRAACASSRCA